MQEKLENITTIEFKTKSMHAFATKKIYLSYKSECNHQMTILMKTAAKWQLDGYKIITP